MTRAASALAIPGLHRRRLLGACLGGAMGGAGAGGLASLYTPPALAAAQADGPALGSAVDWPTLQLLDGPQRLAADWRGQVVVVVFFATWCGYCARHNQRLEKLRQAAQGQPLQVLGVAQDSPTDTLRRYLQQGGLRFAVTQDERPLHRALSPRRSVPLTCVVDRQGRLRERIPGEMTEDDVMQLLRWTERTS